MRAPISTAVSISVGIIVLLGYFISTPLLQNLRAVILGWAVIVAGSATLIGIANLVGVHVQKLTARRKKDIYSILFLVAFFSALFAGLLLGPYHPTYQQVVISFQAPVEASLLAILAVTLAYASLRLLKHRRNLMSLVFVISTVVFLFLNTGFLTTGENIPALNALLSALNRLPVAGARGILLGIALGSLVTGLRILLGADRPYSG